MEDLWPYLQDVTGSKGDRILISRDQLDEAMRTQLEDLMERGGSFSQSARIVNQHARQNKAPCDAGKE